MPEEFAPGIPEQGFIPDLPTVEEPEIWEFAVQRHMADKAGEHFDLRLGDPRSGFAHSWALRHWPEPGEKRKAIPQSVHTLDYMDFEGSIEGGYGKGKVQIEQRDKAEVLRGTPDKIHFNVYKGVEPQELSLIKTKDGEWLIVNRSLSKEKAKDLPDSKPKYVERTIDLEAPDEILQAKLDGAHNLLVFPKSGIHPRIMSYRRGKRQKSGVIEHTHKIPGFNEIPVPSKLRDTIVRGEVYARDVTGKAVRATELGGLLNANVWKSRAKQQGAESPLRMALFDVVRFKGRDVTGWPYRVKLDILDEIIKEVPQFELPPMARTPAEKRRLFSAIQRGRLPESKEGVVAWNLNEPAPPVRQKFRPDHDVYVRGFFDAKPGSKYEGRGVGGFYYSHKPDGPVVGRVGTGLSDALRDKMFSDPERYIGSIATVKSSDKYPGGALRAASFSEWHLDKNLPEFLKEAASPMGAVVGYIIRDLCDEPLP